MSSSQIFPIELESEILLRLPAKALQRFKSVCKSWNNLISHDANFISTFHRLSLRNPSLLFLNHPFQNPKFSITSTPLSPVIKLTKLALPGGVISGRGLKPVRIELVNCNSVNGLLGIVVLFGLVNGPVVECGMYIWNPGSGETVKLPKSDLTGLFDGPSMVKFYSGFGYDKRVVDYKIVRIVYTGSIQAVCEVYSVRRNSWKKLNSDTGIPSNTLWASEMCSYVDGVGYWGVHREESKEKFLILGFRFSDEKLHKVTVPESCIDGREKKFHSLWEFRGNLALSVIHFGGFESGSSRLYIWVYSGSEVTDAGFRHNWSSLFNIELECGPRRPVMSLRTGELVMLGEDDGEHVLYDPVSGGVTRLNVFDVDHVVLYAQSLVSIRRLMPKEDRNELSLLEDGIDRKIKKCSVTESEIIQRDETTVEE